MTVADLKSYRSTLEGLASSLSAARSELAGITEGGRYSRQARQTAQSKINAVDSLLSSIDNEVQAVNEAITEASQPDPRPVPDPTPRPAPRPPRPGPGPGDPVQPREPIRRF